MYLTVPDFNHTAGVRFMHIARVCTTGSLQAATVSLNGIKSINEIDNANNERSIMK